MGVVDDSLHGGSPLSGASVYVLGTALRARTNASGIFRIDSITPGDVQIIVRHPMLDSLLLTVTSGKFALPVDRVAEIAIATPSLVTFHSRFCPRGRVMSGQAIVAGRVDEADTGLPLANATVSLVYIDSAGPSAAQRVRTARTNADGFYAICGLPEGLDGTIQTTASGHASPEVPVSTERRDLVAAGFLVATTEQTGATMSAVLTGRVLDVAGRPVPDAQVAIEGGQTVARTAPDGTFRLAGLPSGTTNASVHKIGFSPAVETVHLRKTEPQELTVSMSAVSRLPTVKVVAGAEKELDRVGFTGRLKMGGRANFLLPEDMVKFENLKLTDVFRQMPGFLVQRGNGNDSFLSSSRAVNGGQQGCVVIYVDRILFEQQMPGDLDSAFPPYQIGAVETYPSPSTTPAEFQLPGRSCATVVMWTKNRLNR